MSKSSESLIQFGFIKEGCERFYPIPEDPKGKEDKKKKDGKKKKDEEKPIKKREIPGEYKDLLAEHADEEETEVRRQQGKEPTGYPKPLNRFNLVYETIQINANIEESYFWLMNHVSQGQGFIIEKIYDIFTASEHSTFFGVAQQRLGLQQDKVSQFLATIGKMVKDLFQLVREIRIHDERLGLYEDSYNEKSDSAKSADITLKGIWVDLVEGGSKNPASVYGMSRELGFATLPDLFFDAMPNLKSNNVDKYVETLQFNRKVKEVLLRKLRTYIQWKESTQKELETKRKFTVQYLRQHYEIIQMYMAWVRPYLKNIERLQMKDQSTNANLVSAFEGSFLEIEVLCKTGKSPNNQIILITFEYRTRPEMNYTGEGYQRGPIHIGQINMVFRGYVWDDQRIEAYKAFRRNEDMKLLGLIDGSVNAAMEALGDELQRYLEEAGRTIEPKKEDKTETSSENPFGSIFKGFGELFGSLFPKPKPKSKSAQSKFADYKGYKDSSIKVQREMWILYNNFKKAHKMITW